MEKILIKPKEGLTIRDPQTMEKVPQEGIKVVKNSFWERRIKTGDVVVDKQKEKKEAKTTTTKGDK